MSLRRDRDALRDLLRDRSVARGDFVLASGARSNYYIDARRTTMSGAGLMLVGAVALDAIDAAGWRPDAVGGLTMGADPVAFAIALAAQLDGRTLDAFSVRKEAKAHGTTSRIEGCFDDGASVVIVEDVITSGDSALRAVGAVQAAGGVVLGVLAVVDREQGGRDRLEDEGLRTVALFRASELL